jgi:hypothetical protein
MMGGETGKAVKPVPTLKNPRVVGHPKKETVKKANPGKTETKKNQNKNSIRSSMSISGFRSGPPALQFTLVGQNYSQVEPLEATMRSLRFLPGH